MSFGFGIGDFLAVFELATKVRDRWIDAPGEYASIKNETKNIGNVLRDIGELGTRMDLTQQHEASLKQACHSCRELLTECERLVDKYSSVQTTTSRRFKVRRTWTRFRVDPDEIRHLRERLCAQISQLSTLCGIIETDLTIDIHEGVQDLQCSDARRERMIVADWYSPADFADQQTDQLSRRENGTGGWFLACAEYRQWCQRANSVLLCPGIPGSGKSVMVATVIDDLQTCFGAREDMAVIYFYCNFNRQAEQDLRRMLATLVRQLFQEQAQLPEAVTTLYQKHRDRATRPSVDELETVLRVLVGSYQRVFVVLDALDECGNTEGQRDRLLDELFSLQAAEGNDVNVFATTRSIDVVRNSSMYPRIDIRADKSDIEVYLASRMTGLARFVSYNTPLQDEIKRRIVDAADGMFLLARLQFDSLRDKTNPGQMKDALARLQRGSDALDGEYTKAVDRIELQLPGWRGLARRVLLWITYATRQLSIDELREAIAIDPDRPTDDLDDYLDDEDQIVSVCHGLVEVDQESRIVRLVHYTTQEYLEKIRDQWLPGGHSIISQSCIAYLSMKVLPHSRCRWGMDLSTTISRHKFLQYAGKNWGVHARTVENKELLAYITKFLLHGDHLRFSTMVTFAFWDRLDRCKCPISDISATHISSHFGLHRILQDLIQQAQAVNNQDSRHRAPLSYAAEGGHTETVQLLLAQPGIGINDVDADGDTALSRAARRGYMGIVQLLLAHPSFAVNNKDKYGRLLLSRAIGEAARGGYVEIARLLLAQPGIEVNNRAWNGETLLCQAANEGYIEVVQTLLTHPGIEIYIRRPDGHVPLSLAAGAGRVEIVQLLLIQPGINISTQNYMCNISLFAAVRAGHVEIVQLLLAQPGIEVNATDESGYTLLSAAARGGRMDIVQLLLTQPGIDINAPKGCKHPPLSEAAAARRVEIVRLLLTQPGIEANITDRYGRTPLFTANYGKYPEIVQLLLAQPGIDVDLGNPQIRTT